MADLPPLPDGFVLEGAPLSPPLPPGFQLETAAPGATRLYSPNPDAPTSYGSAPPTFPEASSDPLLPYRMAGQFAQKANRSFVNGMAWLPDLYGSFAKTVGLASPETPSFSRVYGQAIDDLASVPMRVRDAVSRGSLDPVFAPREAYNSKVTFQPQTRAERVAGDVGSAVGTTLSSVAPGKILAGASAPGSIPAAIGESLSANPVAQGVYTAAGNIVGTETGNPLVGAATTMALPLLTHGVQRTFSAAPAETTQEAERRALLQYGQDNDLGPLTAGKIVNSKGLQTLESASSKLPLPFIGGRVARTEEAGRNAFQRAALEKTGTYGETAVTPDVLAATRDRIGKSFNSLENSTTVHIDPQVGTDLAAARAEFSKQLESQMPKSVLAKLTELESAPAALNQPGVKAVTIDGTTYKNIRSKLSAQLSRAGGADKQALGAMIDALDGAVERSIPTDAVQAWKTARQQWRNYLALNRSVAANNDQTAVGNMSTAAFGRAARGNPDLEKLAQYGNAFVGDKVPNTSGTAAHNVANHLLGGGLVAGGLEAYHTGLLTPHIAIPAAVVGAIPYAAELGLNNPATRAALLARYRNATPAFVKPSLFSATAVNALKGLDQ